MTNPTHHITAERMKNAPEHVVTRSPFCRHDMGFFRLQSLLLWGWPAFSLLEEEESFGNLCVVDEYMENLLVQLQLVELLAATPLPATG